MQGLQASLELNPDLMRSQHIMEAKEISTSASKPNSKKISSELTELFKLEGFIKKKKQKYSNIPGVPQSNKRYFCFRARGKYLCYFHSKPVDLANF